MNSIVIYNSKTGFTKQYAEWIAAELDSDIESGAEVKKDILSKYETIIYGGGVYISKINGVKLIKDNLKLLADQEIIIFATGMAPARKEVITEIKDKNFSTLEQEQIKFFYLRGGFDYEQLNFVDKMLMSLLKLRLKLKFSLNQDEQELIAAYDQPVDFTDRDNLTELFTYLR
ncbi:MAG: flavodoxin domain-containing protein [Bacillota bacterium]